MRIHLMAAAAVFGLAATAADRSVAAPAGPATGSAGVPVEFAQYWDGPYRPRPAWGGPYADRDLPPPPRRIYGRPYYEPGPRVVCRFREGPYGPRRVCFERW